MNEPVLEWLLEGDVAVRFQTRRDLLHRDDSTYRNGLLARARGPHSWRRGMRMVIGAGGSTSRSGRRATTRCCELKIPWTELAVTPAPEDTCLPPSWRAEKGQGRGPNHPAAR